MKCLDFREIIDSYLCDELLTETNHEVLRHLEECVNCRGVIENRRILRSKIKSAVVNSPQFQMRDEFYNSLCIQLKHASTIVITEKKSLWTGNNYWMAFAAGLIFAVGLGFWFLQPQPENSYPTGDQEAQKIAFAGYAVGDHQNCAIDFNLPEEPVHIDLASAQYVDLRKGVLDPLQNSDRKYELLESHICKYNGHKFTHIVFRHEGKTVSVLITDLQNYPALKNDEVAKIFADGYQIARFDVKNKAVFVVSNLSEQENMATARILENPLSRNLNSNEQAKVNSFDNYKAF
ncbi:MAG: zf-HC2 domain-containing protein [Acidobacteriota bacterium]